MDQFFGLKDIHREEMIVLKTVFDALDRPEFLSSVPKVSSVKYHKPYRIITLSHLFHPLVFEPIRNGFKRRNSQSLHDLAFQWPHGFQDNQTGPVHLHSDGAVPRPLRRQLQIYVLASCQTTIER